MQRYVVSHGRRIAVETLETGVAPRRRRADPFVKVPLSWAKTAAKATRNPRFLILVRLLYVAWRDKHHSFRVPNKWLESEGVNRFVKARALRELEAAGLITITRERGKAPLVTLVLP